MGKFWGGKKKKGQSQSDKFRKFGGKPKWQRTARSKLLNKLSPRDWRGVKLEEVKKDFYQEHPNVKARDQARIKEFMDQNRISVKGNNCPKPVEAFDEFGFPDCIMDAIKAQNFEKPTPIQSQAIPVALSGRNMVGIADTGSGKTLAFILPAITHILGNDHPRNIGEPEVVVLAPTRELAQQIQQVVVGLGPGINVTSECFYGGTDRMEQKEVTEKVFEICIATPGRMVDFLSEGYVKLHRCAFFVLDEADRMLDMGFAPQIKRVIGQSRPDRHMLMFSATWPPEIQELAESYLKDYILVNIGSLEISANHNITQKIEFCENDNKPERLVKIMKQVMQEEENKTLIFVNVKVDVDLLTLQFRMNGWEAMGLHGSKKQPERDRVFNDFKTGKISILIATDLAARGLDVDDIKYIINYDYPHSPEDYVHRIGRTARCNRTGTAITLFSQKDRDQAKHLISVLEEAGQYVPPHLRKMLELPPPSRGEKKGKLAGTKIKKKHLKKFMKQKNVNSVPLGCTVNTDKLIGVDEIMGPSIIKEIEASSKKNKRKADKVQATQSQPSFNKKAKTDIQSGSLHTESSNRFMDDHYSGNFENTQWAPSSHSQKYEENSRNTFPRNMGDGNVNIQNPNLGLKGREMGHSSEIPFNNKMSAGDRRGNNMYSADHKNTSMPVNSRNYETSMGPRGLGSSMDGGKYDSYYQRDSNVYPTDYRNTNMPMNSGNYETPMGPSGSRSSMTSGKHDDSYVRRESNVYSTDYRNTTSGISGKYDDDSYVRREGNVYSTDNGNTASMTSGKHDDSYLRRERNVYSTDHRNTTSMTSGKHDDTYVRKEKNVYSVDYRNTNSRNYETSRGPSGSGFSMAGGKHDDSSAGYRNTSMTMNSRNYEASMGARGSGSSTNAGSIGVHMDPSFSARSHGGASFDRRQSDAGGNGAPGRQNSNYKDTHHQTSDWGSSRNSYRMDMNRYPGQNRSGRSGFDQY